MLGVVYLLWAYNSGNSSLQTYLYEVLFHKSGLPIIDAIDEIGVDDKRFQTNDTEVAPPPKVETSFCSQPVLVKQGRKVIVLYIDV